MSESLRPDLDSSHGFLLGAISICEDHRQIHLEQRDDSHPFSILWHLCLFGPLGDLPAYEPHIEPRGLRIERDEDKPGLRCRRHPADRFPVENARSS